MNRSDDRRLEFLVSLSKVDFLRPVVIEKISLLHFPCLKNVVLKRKSNLVTGGVIVEITDELCCAGNH